jgi:hypothetical protein
MSEYELATNICLAIPMTKFPCHLLRLALEGPFLILMGFIGMNFYEKVVGTPFLLGLGIRF